MVRFICHLLIVWLTLLSGGAHAFADAMHEAGHMPVPVVTIEAANDSVGTASTFSQAAEKTTAVNGSGPTEACNLSHCAHGHATGMLPAVSMHLNNARGTAALTDQQPWTSGDLRNTIERPKWVHTTLSRGEPLT